MRLFAVEDKSLGEIAAQLAQTGQCQISAAVLFHFKGPATSNANLDVIALFQMQSFDDACGYSDG
jgi:hypothetical protein